MFLSALKEFFFPHFCPLCGKKNALNIPLCKSCYHSITWFDTSDCCKKCQKKVDVDENFCLNCKKGFFFPQKLLIAISHPKPKKPYLLSLLKPLYCDLLTVFLIENKLLTSIDAIASYDHDPLDSDTIKILSKRLGIPVFAHNQFYDALLLVAFQQIDRSTINPTTMNWLKRGVKKVYIVQAVMFKD